MTGRDGAAAPILQRMYRRSIRYNYAGALVMMINSVVDGMIVSHFLGGQAVAAFGLVMPFYSLMNLIPILLRFSAQTGIGEAVGRGDAASAGRRLSALLATGVLAAAPLMLLLSLWRTATLRLLTAGAAHPAATAAMASEYMLFLTPAMLPIMLCPVLHPVMQLDGDSRRSPRAVWLCAAVNIVCDLIAVPLLHGGMAGIAAATDLSCLTELLVLLLHYRKKDRALRPVWHGTAGIRPAALFSGGLSFMVRELAAFLAGIGLNRLVFELAGETGVSALSVGSAMWLLLLPAATAVSSSGATLGSVAKGESDRAGMGLVLRMGVRYALLPGSALAAAFFAAAGPIAAFCLGSEPESMAMARVLLRCLALSLPLTVLCQAAASHLAVTGRRFLASAAGVLEGGALLLAASWALGSRFGVSGVWAARPAAALVTAALALAAVTWAGKADRAAEKTGETRQIECSVSSVEEAVGFSEQVQGFCLDCGIDPRLSNLAALCVEELACNTLQWGYAGGGRPGVDVRAVCAQGHLTLRFRDGGRPFDPLEYLRQFAAREDDPSKNVGLRIVSGLAAGMRYVSVADCNIVLLRLC